MSEAPHLDERLLAAARLVKAGLPAADIGCDHAKLSAWLVCTGRCPNVIACDLREGPLKKAAATCREYHCEDKVELRLGSGLDPLSPGEAQSIVMAGVSAQTTIEILEAAPWVNTEGLRLVCIPATKVWVLRRWLWEHGFEIKADHPVRAAGRWYTVLAAEYTGSVHQPNDRECAFGGNDPAELDPDYRAHLIEKINKLRRAASGEPQRRQRLDDILAQLNP